MGDRSFRCIASTKTPAASLFLHAPLKPLNTWAGSFAITPIEQIYFAIVRGRPKDGRIESWLVRDRGDGRRGSGSGSNETGERAVTHVRLLKQLGPLSLVECRLESGRTHQIRIHLGEAGCPLAGETIYDRPTHGKPCPDPSGGRGVYSMRPSWG